MRVRKEHRCFGGTQLFCEHDSETIGLPMRLSVYLPGQASRGPVPALYYLSGLTCTEENFTTKAGAQRYAAEHGVVLIAPDTSPRGAGVPGEDASYDFGSGAGFYLNASLAPWSTHYRMYDYVTRELPALIGREFPIDSARQGIFGHSMGGHGALICAMRNPQLFKTVSAFSPIANPTQCPWGRRAFSGYLGDDEAMWAEYDATLLARTTALRTPILVDQGLDDEFLETQLRPEALELACAEAGLSLQLRRQHGYDHSYYFIATFIGDHIAHHAVLLRA